MSKKANHNNAFNIKLCIKQLQMKRDVLYRGKLSDKDEWHYGHYYNNKNEKANVDIIVSFFEKKTQYFPVSKNFLWEFTGELDINKVRIFEGDIVQCDCGIGKVIFTKGSFFIEWIKLFNNRAKITELLYSKIKEVKVISDVHTYKP